MIPALKGRGAAIQPANPYVKVRREADFEHLTAGR